MPLPSPLPLGLSSLSDVLEKLGAARRHRADADRIDALLAWLGAAVRRDDAFAQVDVLIDARNNGLAATPLCSSDK
jgi:hypothetical protein